MSECTLGLIALGVGYWVLLQSNREKGGLRLLGLALGTLIIGASILSGLCAMKCKGGSCPLSGKAPMCPISGKQLKSSEK